MKYCGVVILFCGIRVYIRLVMGMFGLEIVLEELMCCVFGDFF